MSNRPHTRPRRRLLFIRTQRRVWAALTRTPCALDAELAAELHLSRSTVSRALQALRDIGYIHFERGAVAARTVVIPFYEEHR